jgi:hypothetical protein
VCRIPPVGVGLVRGEPQFDQWVCERLARWPTARIIQLELWLREQDADEFMPAVREALRRRGIRPTGEVSRFPRLRAEELIGRLKRLVHARAQLRVEGGSLTEIDAHTAEIERLLAQLAEVAREPAA